MLPVLPRFQPVFTHFGLDVLRAKVEERLSEEELLTYAGRFDGALCGDDAFTRSVLQACLPRLKIISKWGTGIDSIDQPAARELGILIGNTPNAFTLPVADTVLGYILAFARQGPWMDRAIKAGRWEKIPSRALSECTLGVIGMGNIGKAVIHRAHAFGMPVLGTDIIEIDPVFIEDYGVEMTPLEDLLARADFVSLNCDLNPTSRYLINPHTLALMKPTAILINTARGPIVHEPALAAALEAGALGGAALDVFEHEPLPTGSPLRRMDNVLLAAHNANSGPAAWEHVHWNTLKNLIAGLGLDAHELDQFRGRGQGNAEIFR
jgi:D-3-phosphoglycerate dehydrogenase